MKKSVGIAAIVAVVGLVCLLPLQSTAAVVWSEDFGGGMASWTAESGVWTTAQGYLAHESGSVIAYMYHASSQVVGTWSFDMRIISSVEGLHADCLFMAVGTENDYDAYGVRMMETGFYFVKWSGARQAAVALGFVTIPGLAFTWIHVDVTREDGGVMNVFLDAQSDIVEPNITVTDTSYGNSDRFVLVSYGLGQAQLDNVTVNNEITISAPDSTETDETTSSDTATTSSGNGAPPPDMTLLVVGGGAAAVVVVLVVILLKKR